MAEKKEFNIRRIMEVVGVFTFVILVWAGFWVWVDNIVIWPDARGAFGDKFGFVNSFFSGLAFAGIIYSIYLQSQELRSQKEELQLTREEFKDQNFQTTFFNLLKTQRQIAQEISGTFIVHMNKEDEYDFRGAQFFNHSMNKLGQIYATLKFDMYPLLDPTRYRQNVSKQSKPPSPEYHIYNKILREFPLSKETWEKAQNKTVRDIALSTYLVFSKKFNFTYGHYTNHIYQMLSFVKQYKTENCLRTNDQSEIDNINQDSERFADFIQAQMTIPELAVLYYSCLPSPKLIELVLEFNTFKNLTADNLIDPIHDNIFDVHLEILAAHQVDGVK